MVTRLNSYSEDGKERNRSVRLKIRPWTLHLGIRIVYHSAGKVVTYDINSETADAAELEPNTFFLYCLCT